MIYHIASREKRYRPFAIIHRFEAPQQMPHRDFAAAVQN